MKNSNKETKTERLNFRATPLEAHLIQMGAMFESKTLTDYITQAALKAAEETTPQDDNQNQDED